jgi:hypothetical protein
MPEDGAKRNRVLRPALIQTGPMTTVVPAKEQQLPFSLTQGEGEKGQTQGLLIPVDTHLLLGALLFPKRNPGNGEAFKVTRITMVIKPHSVLVRGRGLKVSVLQEFTLKSNHRVSGSGGTLGGSQAARVAAMGVGIGALIKQDPEGPPAPSCTGGHGETLRP